MLNGMLRAGSFVLFWGAGSKVNLVCENLSGCGLMICVFFSNTVLYFNKMFLKNLRNIFLTS